MLKNRVILLAAFIMCVFTIATGQDKLWPEKTDALILLDENEFQVINENKAKFKKHRIVQIFNKAGKEYGNVVIRENKFIKSGKISAKILDTNGKVIRKLDKDEIHSTTYFPEYVLYADSKYRWFEFGLNTFPYIVEYSYEIKYKNLFFWPDWFPQQDIPVLKSTYKLILNNGVDYQKHDIGITVELLAKTEKGKRALVWELKNIKPGIDERFMPPENNVQMALYFAPAKFKIEKYTGSFISWDSFADWYNSLISGKYALPPAAKDKILQLVAETDENKQKVQKLYAFLQDYTRYVNISLGIGGWQPHSVESTFENRYGDCKDLSLLMVSMLKEVGIKAYPALIKTRDNGILIKEFPSPQFNHVITYVPLQKDTLWLECTSKLHSAGELPSVDQGCDVLIVRESSGEIVKTPQSDYRENKWVSHIEGHLTTFGAFHFTGKIIAAGEKGYYLRGNLNHRKPQERKRWIIKRLSNYLPKVDLTEYEIDHLNKDLKKPIIIRFKGTINKFASQSGQRLFINPNILHRETADDLPREEEREFPIYYGYPYCDVDSVSIKIPENFEIEATPKSEKIEMPFGYSKTDILNIDGKLKYCRTCVFKDKQIPASLYEDYLTFMKKIVKKDKSQFVLKSLK